MPIHDRYVPKSYVDGQTTPFVSAEEAWFWFIQAHLARSEGAKIVAGLGLGCRPCEPVDVLAVVERLYRGRRLLMDHILVLRFYGRRQMSPDPQRAKEMRAYSLWQEAMERIEDVLIAKGIVKKPHWTIEKEREYYESKQSISLGEDALGRIFG